MVQLIKETNNSDDRVEKVNEIMRKSISTIDAINKKHLPKVSGAEAYKALQLILAIYESSNSGVSVEL